MAASPSRATGLGLVALSCTAAFAAIYLVWGSTYLAIVLALPAIPPLLLMGSRSLVGGLILFGLARARGARVGRRGWLVGGACGLLFFVGCHGVLAVAEQRMSSGLASILLATIPFWTVLIGLVLPLEKPARPRTLALLAPGFAGVALIAWRELAGAGPALADILMLLGASLSWAFGTVVSERHSGETPAGALAGTALITGGLVLLGLAAVTGEVRRVDLAGLVGLPGLAWAHLTFVGTVVTFGTYVWLLERVSPPLVATYTFVNPMVAVALGWPCSARRRRWRCWPAAPLCWARSSPCCCSIRRAPGRSGKTKGSCHPICRRPLSYRAPPLPSAPLSRADPHARSGAAGPAEPLRTAGRLLHHAQTRNRCPASPSRCGPSWRVSRDGGRGCRAAIWRRSLRADHGARSMQRWPETWRLP